LFLSQALRRAAELDDPLRERIHVCFCRIDHRIEQCVQRNEARPFDIPIRLLGLLHEVDTVRESRVQALQPQLGSSQAGMTALAVGGPYS